jgi:PTS system fructose-specific IIC component
MIAQAAWGRNGPVEVTQVPISDLVGSFNALSGKDWAVLLFRTGGLAFGFLVPVLSGFIAYAIADRPGLVPGFVGGAIAGAINAGFLGGLATGFIGGFLALWISRWKVPKGVRGVMPVVVVPLLSSLLTGLIMFVIIGRPIADLMAGLTSWLNGLSGANLFLLGAILGAMMGFDLGGPINKVAYTFAITGLATEGLEAGAVQFRIMAAVMGAGMVAPLAMALATSIRKQLFTHAERENGKAAWLLGLSFISEGALPVAAADPWRVILSSVIGSTVTGAMIMGVGSELRAPHGGVWVSPLISNAFGFLLSVAVGMVVMAVVVIALKSMKPNPIVEAEHEADEAAEAAAVREPQTV